MTDMHVCHLFHRTAWAWFLCKDTVKGLLYKHNKNNKKHTLAGIIEIHHDTSNTKQDNAQTVYKGAQIEKKGLTLEQVVSVNENVQQNRKSVKYQNILTEKLLTNVVNW